MKTGGRPLLVGARVCSVLDNDVRGTVFDVSTNVPLIWVKWDGLTIADLLYEDDIKEIENDGN